jgi:hypothetical protein
MTYKTLIVSNPAVCECECIGAGATGRGVVNVSVLEQLGEALTTTVATIAVLLTIW